MAKSGTGILVVAATAAGSNRDPEEEISASSCCISIECTAREVSIDLITHNFTVGMLVFCTEKVGEAQQHPGTTTTGMLVAGWW